MIDLTKLECVKQSGANMTARCPVCAAQGMDKSGNHLIVYPDGKFGCALNPGDSAHRSGIAQILSGGVYTDYVQTIIEPRSREIQYFPEDCLKRLIKDYSYWEGRGITAETMSQFEGGVATDGKMKNRYVLVMRDFDNRIIGFSGRYIHPIPPEHKSLICKWKHLAGSARYVFDWQRVQDEVLRTGVIVLSEGPGCKLALAQEGFFNVLPMFGLYCGSDLISFLIALNPKKIIISLNNEPDNQSIGEEAAKKCRNRLLPFFDADRVVIDLPPKKDWLDCSREQRLKFINGHHPIISQ